MAVVPNRLVDGKQMLEAMGEVMEEHEEPISDALMDEINARVAAGKGWSKEERQAYLDNLQNGPELPLFAENADEADPALMEVLAHLKYDGEDPRELAEDCKESGNTNFKRAVQVKRQRYFHEALKHYTEGCLHAMKAKEGAAEPELSEMHALHATLLCNRAACNLFLKNYGSVKRDCTDCLKMAPDNKKALFRKAKACVELKQFDSALEAIDAGLALDADSAELLALHAKATAGAAKVRQRNEELQRRAEEEHRQHAALWERCTAAGARLAPALVSDGYQQQHNNRLPVVGDQGQLEFPVLFLYPQYQQSDFIEGFSESQMLAEHLGMMFPDELEAPACEWDERFEYRCSELVPYIQTHAMVPFTTGDEWAAWVRMSKAARGEVAGVPADVASKRLRRIEEQGTKAGEKQSAWVRVHPACTLVDLLRHPGHVVLGGIPTVTFYPAGSDAHRAFLEEHDRNVTELHPSS